MNINVKDLLKHSFVITIDSKKFDWFKKVFKFHGISPMPKRFQGTTLWYNSGKYNCYLSHRNAILTAKKRKWPYVLVFEDDAYPVNGVVKEMQKCLDELPNDCQVLSFGNILLWDIQGEFGNFWRSYMSYGAHAYVVFRSAYDKYVEMLDMGHEGDSAFYSRLESILPKGSFYMPKKNLFIQYSNLDGVNNNSGYVLIDQSKVYSQNGKLMLPQDRTIPVERAMALGFPDANEINTGRKTPPSISNKDKPLVFATVNAGTNTFTNITVKSLLKFHPNAKVFVLDVPRKSDDKFTLIDDDVKGSVEILNGVLWDELNLPTIDVNEANYLTDIEKRQVIDRFHGKSLIEVLPNGDFQHPMNIQFAIDTLDESFIIVDSDAPLKCPVHALSINEVVTSAQIEEWNYIHLDRLRPLLNPEMKRRRFCPYIQFLNVDMLKQHGMKYFDKDQLKDNLDFAGWFKNPCCEGRESLFFWTGSLFYRNVMYSNLPINVIHYDWYVDHFGGATWQDKGNRHKMFIEKYAHLFKNRDALLGKYA